MGEVVGGVGDGEVLLTAVERTGQPGHHQQRHHRHHHRQGSDNRMRKQKIVRYCNNNRLFVECILYSQLVMRFVRPVESLTIVFQTLTHRNIYLVSGVMQ